MNFTNYPSNSTASAFVLIDSKKLEFSVLKEKWIEKEWADFKASKEIGFRELTFGGIQYFFIKNQKNNEDLRVHGSKLRTYLNKEVKSIQLFGAAKDAFFLAEGLSLSNYQFLKYLKNAQEKAFLLEEISFYEKQSKNDLLKLKTISNFVSWARDLVNEPVSFLNASKLSEEIENKARNTNVTVKILEQTQIEALKMGGLIPVNKGSIDPPTFTVLEYKPKTSTNKAPIVLVGKGVVYDTGGLSLKPTPGSMDSMKCDMAGAAMMAASVLAIAQLELPIHLIGLIPATDNRPGQNAYAPGDIITMYDGTTVEVMNTDAEGRMILADALSYSNKFKPELVIDAATLTGAAVRSFGTKASCVMGNADQKIIDSLIKAGFNSHERLIQVPFWDDYFEEMKSTIADLNNLGGGMAGMITAGKFLEHFVKSPYIHLDIAGPAWLDKKQDYKGQGGTGTGIRLLIEFFQNWK
jgi:leucyl aminopeptidase